jgi:hypothetical protein
MVRLTDPALPAHQSMDGLCRWRRQQYSDHDVPKESHVPGLLPENTTRAI